MLRPISIEWIDQALSLPQPRGKVAFGHGHQYVDAKTDNANKIGRSTGGLVLAFSGRDVMGLAGGEMVQTVEDIEAYTQARENAAQRPFVAGIRYANARGWIDALNDTGPEGRRVAKAVLAVTLITLPEGDAPRLDDPDVVLRQLVLSPEFQVK